MKTVKCDICKYEREVEDNIILSICPSCMVELKEVEENG